MTDAFFLDGSICLACASKRTSQEAHLDQDEFDHIENGMMREKEVELSVVLAGSGGPCPYVSPLYPLAYIPALVLRLRCDSRPYLPVPALDVE